MSINHLIIFIKNPVKGKIKTRLARTIGPENALAVYIELLSHTAAVSKPVMAHRKCYYSDFIVNNDMFFDEYFEKQLQKGEEQGERMYNAFKDSFGEWSEKVILIGSDCYELNSGIIEEAFKALNDHDFVIGPAFDGGYYLIGMKSLNKAVFENKPWSSENVFLDTLLDITKGGYSHYILPTLNDIDAEEDLTEDLRSLINDYGNFEDNDNEDDDF